MPYITKERRHELLLDWSPRNPGELNYLITQQITNYLNNNGYTYATMNDVLGALEGAKLEFYRRIVGPYETLKMSQNGDVYDSQQKAP